MSEINKIKSDEIVALARGQAVVEARQILDGEAKVLSVTAACYVRPSEVFAGEARYAGRVRFDCLVYADGTTKCVSTVSEFSDKIASPKIGIGINPVLTPEIVNCEARADGGTLKMTAVVDTTLRAAVHCDCDCMAEPETGIYAEKCEVEYSTVVAEPTETLYITDSIQNVKLAEIMFASSSAVVTNVECAADEVKISGGVYTTVAAKSADGMPVSFRAVTPFAKSIAAPGADGGDTAFCSACVSETAASFVDDASDSRIELSITLAADATVVRNATAHAVADVFCADCELETSTVEATLCKYEPQTTIIDAVDGQVALDDTRPAADNVLCVTNTFCTLSKAEATDRKLNVEGLVGGDIVYYNAESNATEAIAFRLPFSMPLGIQSASDEVDVTATVTDVTVKVRRESVFDVKADVAFTARFSSRKTATLVQSAKRGEPIARPDATVIVHVASPGESLWQAARALGCSPELVTAQNASFAAPYSGGERLVNFCKK